MSRDLDEEKWSTVDQEIINFVKQNPVIYNIVRDKYGNSLNDQYADIKWSIFAKKHCRGALPKEAAKLRWEVIRTRYYYCSAKKANKNSKYFDGSLSFLDPIIKEKDKDISSKINKCANSSQEIHDESKNDQTSDNGEKDETDFENELTSKMCVFQKGSLVSGEILDIDSDEDNDVCSENETLAFYKECIGVEDVNEEFDAMLENNAFHQECISAEENTVGSSVELNTDNSNMSSIILKTEPDESNYMTISEEPIQYYGTQNPQESETVDFPVPNTKTRDFFKQVGKYAAKNLSNQKQKEFRMNVWSLVTAAEVDMLGKPGQKSASDSILFNYLNRVNSNL